MHYLEVVEMLSDDGIVLSANQKERLDHIIQRKKDLALENKDLDEVLDELLRNLQMGKE